jgi:hypothetical protein
MSNPGGINLNISPYFDNYDEDKKFVRVLYRPGRAVQARELIQAQTYQQKQIERFAGYFFKQGALIDGCETFLDLRMDYVKLQSTFSGAEVNVTAFKDVEIVGGTTGIRAYVGLVSDIENNDPKTLYINYLSSGALVLTVNATSSLMTVGNNVNIIIGNDNDNLRTATLQAFWQDPITSIHKIAVTGSGTIPYITIDDPPVTANTILSNGSTVTMNITASDDQRETKTFANSELIFTKTYAGRVYANTASTNAVRHIVDEGLATEQVFTKGSKVTIGDGVIYISEHFIKNTTQSIILDKYSNEPSYKVGLVPSKSFVDSIEDTSLVDNAAGTPNFQAPGADRLKIDTVLTKIALNEDTDETEFVSLLEVQDGVLKKRKTKELEGRIEEAIAKRTYEESGDYTVSDPKVSIREHLNQGDNNGRFSLSEGGNNELLLVEVDPFVSYVQGFRNELLARGNANLHKGLDTQYIEQVQTQLSFGSFVYVKELVGAWDFMESSIVDLRNTAQQAISKNTFGFTSVTGSKIGEARIKSVEYISGVPGTASAVYNLYLYNITMNSGKLFEDVRAIHDSVSLPAPSRFADIVLDSLGRAMLKETAFDKMIWELPYNGIKTLRDDLNNVETGFEFRKEFTLTFNTGVATIATTDTTETFSGTGVLTEIQKNRNYIVIPTETKNTANLVGKVSVTGNTVTSSSTPATTFLSSFNVGDIIRIGTEDIIIDSITDNTHLTLKSNHTAGATNVEYYKVLPAGLPIGLGGVGSTGPRTVDVATPSSVRIDLKENASFNAKVVATMNRANAKEKAKILNYQQQTIINANTHSNGLAGPYSLGYADGYQLHAVYQSSGFNITPSTSNTNVTANYVFDNGQRDNTYEHATITPKIGVVPTGQLLVVYDYFSHDTTQGVGYASINSYPINDSATSNTTINTADVPTYTSTRTGTVFALKDCVDFRLIKTANTTVTNPTDVGTYQVPTGGLHIPTPSSNFTADLIYYKGRIARLFVNSNGDLGINDGSPGNPIAFPPPQIPDTLELAEFSVPPYPSKPSDIAITTFKNRRFTMKDIGKIQERVNKLEYYTALNLLEREARDKVIIDDEGLDRFKNGLLVDPFTGHNVADVLSESYRAAIDRQEKYVTSYSDNNMQVGLSYASTGSSGVVITPGRKLMLSYTESTFADQPYASTGLNLAQDLTYTWVGDMEILPATDNWLNTIRDPKKDFVVDLTGQADNWKKLADAWNTEVAPLNRHWVGVDTRVSSTFSTNQFTRADGRLQRDTVRRDVVQQTQAEVQQNAVIDIAQQDVKQAVDRVADISIPHIMRSRDFIFEARSLKDGVSLYAFFDGVNVTANCTQIALIGNTTIDDVYNLFNNDGILATNNTKYVTVSKNTDGSMRVVANKIYGKFRVPANSFYVGQREFKLTDDIQNRDSSATTYAKMSIFAQGLSIVKGQDVLNTRPFKILFDDPRARETVSRRTTTTVNETVVNTIVWDPVSQSFYVDDSSHPDGIFMTSIDLYFKQKSTNQNLGATVEIREMSNGFPTRKIIGGEVARRENFQINVSASAATATTFTFKNPIYLLPGTEYCFTIRPDGNSTDFVIWTAELGQIDITNPQVSVKIDKQPAAGVVFTSSNDFTWSVRQNQDIKFKMKIAQFSTTTTGVAILQNLGVANNITYTSLISNVENLTLSKTNIFYELRQADAAYQLTDFIPIKNLERIIETSSKQISNTTNETAQNIKSLSLRAILSTENKDISPYIDLQRVNVALSKNIINNKTFNTLSGTVVYSSGTNVVTGTSTAFNTEVSAGEYVLFGEEYRQVTQVTDATHMLVSTNFSANGSSVTAYSQNEENPTGPYASESRYITRRVALNDGFEASDLTVYLDINRPAGTSIKVYYKILNENDTDTFDSKFYNEMALDGTETFSQNLNSFSEEKYIVSAQKKTGGTQILNGTVAITDNSVDVLGTSTRFFEEVKIGDTIAVGISRIERVVASVSNNNFLTVSSVFHSTASGQDIYTVLNNVVGYNTPDDRNYSGFKYFAIKIVFLSENIAYVPKVKNLRVIALA